MGWGEGDGVFQIQRPYAPNIISKECLWVTFTNSEIEPLQSHHLDQSGILKCIH